MGAAGTWVVYVLADDSYAYLEALNTLRFFAIRFHIYTWVRWIVRDCDC